MQASHLRLGAQGEQFAAVFLHRHGYNIVDRNWRFGHLELDLVCEHNGWIVFVEVKTRSSAICGGGAGAVNGAKRRNLVKAAQAWLSAHNLWEKPCRFDVLCLTGSAEHYNVEHYRNAFDYSETLGNSNSHW